MVDTYLEGQLNHDHHDGNTESHIGTACNAEDTEHHLEEGDGGCTAEVECTSANVASEVDGGTGSDNIDGLDSHRKIKRHGGGHASAGQATVSALSSCD